MKIYITARWGRRDEMRSHRISLEKAGHKVNSRWLDEPDGTPEAKAASIDLTDICMSDVLVVFSETPDIGYYTGGRHVEFGYAIALDKRIIVIGPRENIFMHVPTVHVVSTLEEAIEFLARPCKAA